MHVSNVWSAWVLQCHDRLADAVPSGLGLRDVEALVLLEARPGSSQDWLQGCVGLSQPGAVRLVDRLAAAGLVERSRDGRRAVLHLTRRGRDTVRRWHRDRDAALEEATSGLGDEDRQRLADLLGRQLAATPRDRATADRTCRGCRWAACEPACPVDRSVTG